MPRLGSFTAYRIPEWRWWLRFSPGVWFKRPYRIKRKFMRLDTIKLMKGPVEFNRVGGTPRKSKLFDQMRISKRYYKNRYHFTKTIY